MFQKQRRQKKGKCCLFYPISSENKLQGLHGESIIKQYKLLFCLLEGGGGGIKAELFLLESREGSIVYHPHTSYPLTHAGDGLRKPSKHTQTLLYKPSELYTHSHPLGERERERERGR